jgi:S-layer homology domain
MARKPAHSRMLASLSMLAILLQSSFATAAPADPCPGGDIVDLPNGTIGCTHGPDERPVVVPQASARLLEPASTPTVTCVRDGRSGNRIQAVYVVAADRPNRSAEVIPQIRQWIDDVDAIFAESSAGSDVEVTVRWVHDEDCVADVATVVVPASGDDGLLDTIEALDDAGYADPGRHYLMWVDASVYCGVAVNYPDDTAGQENTYPLWARVDRDCWGLDGLVEAHELTHMLGAVQLTAPNSSGNGHCTDEYDIMCYPDAPGVAMDIACGDTAEELRLDCNDDDYFDVDPPPGSYLHTHWNVARSSFLHSGAVGSGRPPEPTVGGFSDVTTTNVFAGDITWLAVAGITKGCNPPSNDRFCPDDPVTRGQMAAFLARVLGLDGPTSANPFRDDDGLTFEGDIERLAAARITTGCGDGRFCPDEPISRGEMAAFLRRALGGRVSR